MSMIEQGVILNHMIEKNRDYVRVQVGTNIEQFEVPSEPEALEFIEKMCNLFGLRRSGGLALRATGDVQINKDG